MDKQQLYNLLTKYKDNTCSEEELAQLELWYQSLDRENKPIALADTETLAAEMLLQFRQQFLADEPSIPFYKKYIGRIAVAASIAFVLIIGSYFILSDKGNPKGTVNSTKNSFPQDVLAPEGSKAIITLAKGRKILLDSLQSGTLAVQGNVNIIKTRDGRIIYDGASAEIEYNTIFNPRGSGVVPLTLSDGTKVWLNSESSIRFPAAFAGNKREVEITGEAYFEVAKSASKKFTVKANDVTTEVLGTHFNINTYADESLNKITLLEGSVKVSKGSSNNILSSGQQAQVSFDIKIIDNVDTEAVIAWKNGLFQFANADLQMVMRQLARWYDLEVSFEGKLPKRKFEGKIQRELSLTEVLDALSKNQINYKIDGKKLVILK